MPKSKNKILVIDDGEEMLEGIKIVLEDEGYEVLALTNSKNIKGKIKEFTPSLILMDYMMPGKDGGQVTKELKMDKKYSFIPIVMFSATQQIEKIAFQVGANDFIAKPFDLDLLMQKIRDNAISY